MSRVGRKAPLVISLMVIILLSSLNLFYIFPIQYAFADITNGAVIAYISNTGSVGTNSPKVRIYDSGTDTYGSEIELDATGTVIRDVRVKCSPTDSRCVLVSLGTDGTLNSWVCDNACDTASGWTTNFGADFADLWSSEPAGPDRPFDIEFEDQSGDLLVVYDKVSTVSGEELFYRVLTAAGTSFGGETAIDTQTANSATDRVYSHIILARDDGNDKIGRVETDISNSDVNAGIWSGTAWGDNASITAASTATHDEHIGIAWETNSGDLFVVGADTVDISYREYTTSWQTAGLRGAVATAVGDVNWIALKPTPRSAGDEIFLAFSGSLNDFASSQWTGTSWSTGTEHDAAIDGADVTRVFDIMISPAADGNGATVDAILVWGTANNAFNYRAWSQQDTYGTISTVTNTGTHLWFTSTYLANPTSGDSVDNLAGVQDNAFDISRIEWSGGTNAPTNGENEVTTDTVNNTFERMSLDWFYVAFSQEFTRSPTLGITVAPSVDGIALLNTAISQALTLSPAVDGIALLNAAISQALTVAPAVDGITNYLRGIALQFSVAQNYNIRIADSDDRVELSYTDLGTTSLTYVVRFNIDTNVNDANLFSFMRTLIRIDTTELRYWPDTDTGPEIISISITEDSWHTVVVTQTGSTCDLYLDDVQLTDDGTCVTIDNLNTSNRIGRYMTTSNMIGYVDEVIVYNTFKTASEAHDIYTGRIDTTGMVHHWKLNEGFGTTTIDSFGTNVGTVAGSATWSLTDFDVHTVRTTALYARAQSATITLDNAVSAFRGLFTNVALSITVGDSVAYLREAFANVAQAITLDNTVDGTALYIRDVTVSFILDAFPNTLREVFVNLTQGITLDNTVNSVLIFGRNLALSITVGDDITRTLNLIRVIAQPFSLVLSVVGQIPAIQPAMCDFAILIAGLLEIAPPCQ